MPGMRDWGLRFKLVISLFAILLLNGGITLTSFFITLRQFERDTLPEQKAVGRISTLSVTLLSEYREYIVRPDPATLEDIEASRVELEEQKKAFARTAALEVGEAPLVARIEKETQILTRSGEELVRLRDELTAGLTGLETAEGSLDAVIGRIRRFLDQERHQAIENNDWDSLLTDALPELEAITGISEAAHCYLSKVREYLLEPAELTRTELSQVSGGFDSLRLAFSRSAANQPEERPFIAQIESAQNEIKARGLAVLATSDELVGKIEDLEATERRLSGSIGETLSYIDREADQALRTGSILAFGAVLLSVVLSTLLAWFVASAVARPVTALRTTADRFGAGELDERAVISSQDEVGQLAAAFNRMAEALSTASISLEKERDYTESIVRSMADTLMVVTPTGTIQTVNPATLALLGYTDQELLGKPFELVVVEEEEEEGEGEEESRGTRLQELVEAGDLQDRRLRYKAKSGAHIPMNLNGSVLRDAAGRIVGVVCVARDMRQIDALIEDLGSARQFSEGIVRTVPSALATLDAAGRIVSTNPAFASLFGGDGVNQSFDDFLSGAELLLAIDKARMGEERSLEISVDLPAHPQATLSVTVTPFQSPADAGLSEREGARVLVVIENVTAMRRLAAEVAAAATAERAKAAELAKALVQLEVANKELNSFSYSISHDLRAPLRHLTGFSDLLLKNAADSLDDRCSEYVRDIWEAATEMGQLVDDLLEFSRMTRSELEQKPLSMNTLVKEAIREFDSHTDGGDINWLVGEFPRVKADRTMLKSVLVNLISNAVKFSARREQPEIEIGHEFTDGEDVFFVRDNGVGFEMEYVDKMFGVFQRLHREEEFSGTGIGLASVQRLIHHHGGRVWAEGVVDGGATLYFTVPGAIEWGDA